MDVVLVLFGAICLGFAVISVFILGLDTLEEYLYKRHSERRKREGGLW